MTPAQHKAASWPYQPVIDVDYRVVAERRKRAIRKVAIEVFLILFAFGWAAAIVLSPWWPFNS